MKKIWILFLIALSSLSFSSSLFSEELEIERRAAFDIGSGSTKMIIADVDLTTNKIVNVVLADAIYVGLRENIGPDGDLSSDIQNKAIEAILTLMKKAAPFQPLAYHAVATEPLRLAKNAEALVQRIKDETGVSVTILSQKEEGVLGFLGALAQAKADPDQAVSWDFGGGSFQITTKCGDDYLVYQGKLGKTPMKNALLKIQKKDAEQTFSPNPISDLQAEQGIQFIKNTIQDVPVQLRQKLHNPDVVILGIGINPLWGMQNSETFNKTHVLEELNSRLNLDDAAIRIKDSIPAEKKESFTHIVSNLILAYGMMEALDIPQIHYVGTYSAIALGALLSHN
ncbi:MAG: hypothetical protein V4494_01340 [Chlamydiota bacterium]